MAKRPTQGRSRSSTKAKVGSGGVQQRKVRTGTHKKPSSSSRVHQVSNGVRKVHTHAPGKTQAIKAPGKTMKTAVSHNIGKIRGMSLTVKFSLVICFLNAFLLLGFSTAIFYQVKKNMDREKQYAGLYFCQALTPLARLGLEINDQLEQGREEWIDKIKAPAKQFEKLKETEGVVSAAIVRRKGDSFEVLTGFGGAMSITPSGKERELVLDNIVYKDISVNEGTVKNPVKQSVFWFRKEVKRGSEIVHIFVILSKASIEKSTRMLIFQIVAIGVIFVLLGFFVAFGMASVVVKPIRQLVSDMATVSKGNLNHKTTAHSRDEIGLLANTFNIMTKSLSDAQEIEREKLLIDSELEVASDIQARLLPDKTPQLQGYGIAPFYRSAKDVGGDYYDFIPLDANHLGIVVADVSGKGIIGSMVMSITRTVLRLVSQRNLSAADTLSKVNRVIAQDIRRGMFVTAFYCVLDVPNRELLCSSAGHNPMLIYRESERKIELVNPKGIALGFNKGPIFDKTVKEENIKLYPGDMIVLYTDGVVEAMDEQNREYTEDRFYKFCLEHARESAGEFVDNLLADVDGHSGRAPQSDDITIVSLKVE